MNTWYQCRGCSGLIGLLGDGLPPYYRPGSVAHTKPFVDINVRPAQCRLYQETACEELWRLHEHDTPVEGPANLQPVDN